MHEHDQDLIMTLAEGALGPEETTAARAEIAACRQCADELVLQQTAFRALREAPDAALTEFESHRLRRNLKRELGIASAPAVQVVQRRRFLPVAVLGGAAAVLLTVVIAGGALQSLRGSGDDDAGFAVAAADATSTTASAQVESAEVPQAGDSVTGDFVAETSADERAAGGDAAAGVTTTAQPDTSPPQLAFVSSADDLDTLRGILAAEGGGDPELTKDLALGHFLDAAILLPDSALVCGAETLSTIPDAVGYFALAAGEIDGIEVIVVAYVTEEIENSVVIAHDAATCEPMATSP